MSYAFNQCSELMSLDLSSFKTSKVVNMTGMFNNCYQLMSVNLLSFDTSSVKSMNVILL
jgi:surface protein